jgi:hypothetical protein
MLDKTVLIQCYLVTSKEFLYLFIHHLIRLNWGGGVISHKEAYNNVP